MVNSRNFAFKLVAGILFGISWIYLLIMKTTSDISLSKPFYWSLGLTLLFIVSLFIEKIQNLMGKLEEKEGTPKPISEEEVDKIINKIVNEAGNYRLKGVVKKQKAITVNENIIYVDHVKLYRPIKVEKSKTDEIIIIINATFPDMRTQILPGNCLREELDDSINKMSKNWYNPDIQETQITTNEFGRPVQTTKKISFNKTEEKKEDSVV